MNCETYDLCILGGGISGSILGIRTKELNPTANIVIIENLNNFHKKVGESISDIAGMYLRRFGIDEHLKSHTEKTGLNFIFNGEETENISETSQFMSPSKKSIANGFHIERNRIEEFLLNKAETMGIKIYRPWKVIDVNYKPFSSRVLIENDEDKKEIISKWIADCAGRKQIMAKKLSWKKEFTLLNTASIWGHFKNTQNISDKDCPLRQEKWNHKTIGSSHNATTHFMGKGYWFWHIPLADETVSVGLVVDKNILGHPNKPKEFFWECVNKNKALKTILSNEIDTKLNCLPNLSYLSKNYSAPGLVLIGDSAAFIDPLFSPGIELATQQIEWTAPHIAENIKNGSFNQAEWMQYEKDFKRTLASRVLLYENRYKMMGNFKAFSALIRFEMLGYYIAHVLPVAGFPQLHRKFKPFNKFSRIIYSSIKNRITALSLQQDQRKNKQSLPQTNLSHVSVPKNRPLFIFKYLQLFILAISFYLKFEVENFIQIIVHAKKKKERTVF